MKTLTQIREASHDGKTGDKEAYQAFFKKALKKFGVTEPDQLKGDKEKEFYDYVDAGWKGDNEKPEPGDKKEGISKSVTYGKMKGKKKKQVDEVEEGLVKGRGFPGIKADKKKKNKRVSGQNKNIAYNYDRDKRKESIDEDDIDEGKLSGIAKALTNISGKPEYKKIARNLKSLAMRANEGDKGAAKQIKTQLAKLASKVDKKAGAKLTKMSGLAATYEEVEVDEAVSVDMRTRGFKSAMARNLLRKEKAQAKKKSEIDEIIDATNAKLRGEDVSVGAGSVNMGQGKPMKPMARRKKKGKHDY